MSVLKKRDRILNNILNTNQAGEEVLGDQQNDENS
jgi:hypothetical protein